VAPLTKVKTLLVFGRETGSLRGIYASGGVGFLHDLLIVAGGTDAFDEARLITTTTASPSGRDIVVQGWPEDAGWSTAITGAVGRMVPELEPQVGLAIPGDGRIVVREGARFFRPDLCTAFRRDAVRTYLPNFDRLDFSPLFDLA